MRLVEESGIPTIVITIDRTVIIGHRNIPNDPCLRGIGGDNCRNSMKRTACLIEINRACYVIGNCGYFATRFINRIYLDGQCDWNIQLPQLLSE